MKQQMGVGGLVMMLVLCLASCGPEGESLTAAQLAEKYPDKRYAQIDGVSLHYEQEGLGRPLVFLHGLLTYSHLWRNITPGLTFGNTIYSLDLMGCGFSEKPHDKTYSLDTYVNQLAAFLDSFHLDNPILAGHDLGGVIVTLYTLRNPDKVRKLIIIDAPLYSAAPPLAVRLLRTKLIGELFTGDWFLKRILRGGVAKETAMPDALVDDYLRPYHEDPGARAALLKLVRELELRPVLENEIQPNLNKLQLPTLVMWGDSDAYVPLDFGKKLDQEIPNADFAVILRSGHYVQEERPEEVRAVLKEFIEK
jgi:pimeloyl-ACP methyl ester carboxylesterase